jgi:hypothetical protein
VDRPAPEPPREGAAHRIRARARYARRRARPRSIPSGARSPREALRLLARPARPPHEPCVARDLANASLLAFARGATAPSSTIAATPRRSPAQPRTTTPSGRSPPMRPPAPPNDLH